MDMLLTVNKCCIILKQAYYNIPLKLLFCKKVANSGKTLRKIIK